MPKIDFSKAPRRKGSRYPKPFDEPCLKRENIDIGDGGGLTQFGVNITILPPGVWSSQRHWHEKEDEFAYVLSGEVMLIEDGGETLLRAGDAVAWKAGARNGHHLINRSNVEARILVVGSKDASDWGEYPDIDLRFARSDAPPERVPGTYTHKDGKRY